MGISWDEFDKKVDLNELKKDVKDAQNNKRSYVEVPTGQYEVRINKIELKLSKAGSPMLAVQFRILEGQYANKIIFMNQVIASGFGIHMSNEFLRSLDSGLEINFETYGQYEQLILEVSEQVEGMEYCVDYGENDKGYKTFEITEVFETAS